jgi:two-component system KDP operon response regulator KdpE
MRLPWQIHRFLKPALEGAGYTVLRANTGAEALRIAASSEPALVLLDLGLPDIDGQEVLAKIRSFSQAPVIVLSARDREIEKIKALDNGANDYVEKPFGLGELLARIRNTIKWHVLKSKKEVSLVFDDIQLDDNFLRVVIEQGEFMMTKTQYRILRLLLQNRGAVMTHDHIVAKIWGNSADQGINYLRIYISQIRNKLGEYGEQHIKTRIGVGYCFE